MYLIFLLLGVVHGKTIGDYSENYLKWNIVDGVIPDNLAADRGCDRELQLSTSRPSNYVPISCADIRYSVYDKHVFSLDPQKVDVSRKYSVKRSAYDNGVCKLTTAVPHVDTTFQMYENGKGSPFLNRYGYCDGTLDAPTLEDSIVITTESCDDSGYAVVKTRDECTEYSEALSLVEEVSDANRPFGCNDGRFNSFDRTTASDLSEVVNGYKSDRAAEIKAEYDLLVLNDTFTDVPTFNSGVDIGLLSEAIRLEETITTTTTEKQQIYPPMWTNFAAYPVVTYCGWKFSVGCTTNTNDWGHERPRQRLNNCYDSCVALNYPNFWITRTDGEGEESEHVIGRCVCYRPGSSSSIGYMTTLNDYYSITYETTTVERMTSAAEILDIRLENIAKQIMSMWDKVIYYNKLTDYMTALNEQMKTTRTVLLRMGELNTLYNYYNDVDIDGYNDISFQTEGAYGVLRGYANQNASDLNVDDEYATLGMLLGEGNETYDSLYTIYENYMNEYNSANSADKCVMNAKHRYRTTVIGCIPGLDFNLECIPDNSYYTADCLLEDVEYDSPSTKNICASACVSSRLSTYHRFQRRFHIYTPGNRVDDIYNNADYDQWKLDNPFDDFNDLRMWHSDPNTELGRTGLVKEEEYEHGSSATQHGFRFITDTGDSLRTETEFLKWTAECPYDSFCVHSDVWESAKEFLNYYDLRYTYESRVSMMDLQSIYDNMESLTFGTFDDAPNATSTAAYTSLPDSPGRIGLINQEKNKIFVKEIEHLAEDKTTELNVLYIELSKLNIACGTPCGEGDVCLDFTAELTIPEFTGEFVDEPNSFGPAIRGNIYLGASSTSTVHPRREGDRLFFSAQSEKSNVGMSGGPIWGVFTDLNGADPEVGLVNGYSPTTMSATFKVLTSDWNYYTPYWTFFAEQKVSLGNFQSSRNCLRELCYNHTYSSVEDAKAGCHDHCQHRDGLRVYWDPSEPREASRVYDHKAFECSCGDPLDEFECVMSGKQWKTDIFQTQYRYEPTNPVATKDIVPVTTYLYCPLSHCTQGYVDKNCGRGDQGTCSRGSWFNGACIMSGSTPFCKNEFVEEKCMCHTETCTPGYYCTKAGVCKPVVRKDKKMLQVRYNYLEQS